MADAPPKPRHRATYATDKRKGGYLVRVSGPTPAVFAGRTVPVTLKSGGEQPEELDRLIWTGKDNESGEPVSLYSFKSKPRDDREEIPF
jgi:hypothetical protein